MNWSASINYPHSRACPLIGSFLLGFTDVTEAKGTAIALSYSDARLLVPFSGVSNYDNRERVFMFDYHKKEEEHQNTRQSDLYSRGYPHTNQIASCSDALSFA
jgi:hypothetical protein